MFANTRAYSGFAVNDLANAEDFYGDTLGINTSEHNGLLTLHLAGDRDTLVYPKPDHTPASYTILNFPVDDSTRWWTSSPRAACSSSATRGWTRTPRGSTGAEQAADRLVHRPGRQHSVRAPGLAWAGCCCAMSSW